MSICLPACATVQAAGMCCQVIREDQRMNKDILRSKWRQMRYQIQVTWNKLTDDDLERVAGKYDVFVALLQEKYGYTRELAEEEVDRQINEA